MKISSFSINSEPNPAHLGQYFYPERFPETPVHVHINIGDKVYSDITNNVCLLCLSLSLDSKLAKTCSLKHFVISLDSLFDVQCAGDNRIILQQDGNQYVDAGVFCSAIDEFVRKIVHSSTDAFAARRKLSRDVDAAQHQPYYRLFV
jgi:hypothetical protein